MSARGKCGWPITLWLGVGLIGFCELMLFAVDLPGRNWQRVPQITVAQMPAPQGFWQVLGRVVAHNMTPMCWVGYLLVFDGLLTGLDRRKAAAGALLRPRINPIRGRPNRFVFAWLTSIPVWCFFDWVNFYHMRAWYYHELPQPPWSRYPGYFVAFAAISPGMLLAAQWLNQLGLARLRTAGVRIPRAIQVAVLLLGVVFLIYPLVTAGPVGSLTLWVSLIFLLDPVNHWLGEPSVIGDWRAGRWGRTLSLFAAGGLCGFCWEFWNFWASTKWTYDLPFLGSLENLRIFEMPMMGFLGFFPFAIECWVVLNSLTAVLSRLGLNLAEPLPDEQAVI